MCSGPCARLWLAAWNNLEAWQGAESCSSGLAGTVFGSCDKGGRSVTGDYRQGQSRERSLSEAPADPPGFRVKAAHRTKPGSLPHPYETAG